MTTTSREGGNLTARAASLVPVNTTLGLLLAVLLVVAAVVAGR